MPIMPLPQTASNVSEIKVRTADSRRSLRMAAAGTLLASGVLLIAGKRRPGLSLAITGTVLVMIEQREAVAKIWNALPRRLSATQEVLCRAQAAVEDLTVQSEKLRHILRK